MKYNVGDRVAFMSRELFRPVMKRTHKVGYIKQVRKSWFGTRYVICVSKSDEMWIVPGRDIFNKVERKEKTDMRTDV